jgi:cytochrome c2
MIYGRVSGSDLHYPRYSDKMIKSQVLWTRTKLKKFMMNPNKVIKGTKCVIESGKGVPRDAEAWDIAEFLKKFTMASFVRLNSMVSVFKLRSD